MAKGKRGAVEKFLLPEDIDYSAKQDTRRGVRIEVTPAEIVLRMREADEALNGDSNDAEHDALYALREWLSDIFEEPTRRTK